MANVEVNLIAGLGVTATLSASELNVTISFGETIAVDAELSATSTNPVQNQAIHTALGLKVTAPTQALTTEPEDTNYLAIFTTTWLQLTWANVKAWLKSYFDGLYSSKHKPLDFSESFEINATNIATYNGATLTCTAASDVTITVAKDAEITEPIAVCQGGNGVVTWVAGADVTINNDKKTAGIGKYTVLDPRITANNFNCVGGVA